MEPSVEERLAELEAWRAAWEEALRRLGRATGIVLVPEDTRPPLSLVRSADE